MGNGMSSKAPNVPFHVLKKEIAMLGEDTEMELEDGEAGQINYKRCKKSDGHSTLNPWRQFSMDKLPPAWRTREVMVALMYRAANVVKITVPYISPNRPEGYFFHHDRGKWIYACGSGFALNIGDVLNQEPIDCPVKNCKVPGPHKVTPMFTVMSATHVVFDQSEAEHVSVEFFYDQDKSPVVKCEAVSVELAGTGGDNCTLSCVSHDLQLFVKWNAYRVVSWMWGVLKQGPPPPPSVRRERRSPLVVVISHPHGCPKHISLGDWVGYRRVAQKFDQTEKMKDLLKLFKLCHPSWREGLGALPSTTGFDYFSPDKVRALEEVVRKKPDITRGEYLKLTSFAAEESIEFITYTASTCPGSSGAAVLVFFEKEDESWGLGIATHHFKSKRKSKGVRVNASGHTSAIRGFENIVNNALPYLREEKPHR